MIRDFLDWFKSAKSEDRKKVSALLLTGLLITVVALAAALFILKKQDRNSSLVKGEEITSNLGDTTDTASPATLEKLTYELNQVSMAVMNKKGTKTAYAQFSLILNCPNDKSLHLISQSRAKLLDGIFSVGSQFFLDDFMGEAAPAAFDKFKNLLIADYRVLFQDQAPTAIVLKDWALN